LDRSFSIGGGQWASTFYGGSNVGNGLGAAVQDVPSPGRAQSIEITLPPLGTLFLVPA